MDCHALSAARHVARIVERIGAYGVLVGKSERRTTFGRPRSRWDDYIKVDLQEVGWRNMIWIDLALYRDRWRGFVNAVMKLSGSIICEKFLDSLEKY